MVSPLPHRIATYIRVGWGGSPAALLTLKHKYTQSYSWDLNWQHQLQCNATWVLWVASWGTAHWALGIPGWWVCCYLGSYTPWKAMDLPHSFIWKPTAEFLSLCPLLRGKYQHIINAWCWAAWSSPTGDAPVPVQSNLKWPQSWKGQVLLWEESTLLFQCNFSMYSHHPWCWYFCFQLPSFHLIQASR